MSGYGFKKPSPAPSEQASDKLDLSGFERASVAVDPRREAEAVARGTAIGFVDRAERVEERGIPSPSSRRRRETVPQGNLFIKGPQETLDWFVNYTNDRGHRSYWQALEELRALAGEKVG